MMCVSSVYCFNTYVLTPILGVGVRGKGCECSLCHVSSQRAGEMIAGDDASD